MGSHYDPNWTTKDEENLWAEVAELNRRRKAADKPRAGECVNCLSASYTKYGKYCGNCVGRIAHQQAKKEAEFRLGREPSGCELDFWYEWEKLTGEKRPGITRRETCICELQGLTTGCPGNKRS